MLKVRLLSHTPNVEKVVATAGKLCYSPSSIDQLQENLTEEQIEKFINQVVSAGHHSVVEHASFTFGVEGVSRACYDSKTEVYTNQGWKFFKDLDGTEKILSRNQDGTSAFEKPLNYTKFNFKGKMHRYISQNIDLCITPNHKMFIKKCDVRIKQDYKLVASEDINVDKVYTTKEILDNKETPDYFIIPGYSHPRKLNNGGTILNTLPELQLESKNFIKFLAWYLSEGSTYYNENENSFSISIAQSNIDGNRKNIADILHLIEDLGFTPSYDGNSIRFKNRVLGLYLKSLGKSYEKYIPNEIFNLINRELAKLFIETYEKADGTVDKNGCSKLFTTSKILSDQLQMMSFIAGYTGKIHVDNRVGESHYNNKCGNIITHKHICYVLNISKNKRNRTPLVKRSKHLSLVDYDDYVYCVEVPNHVIFIRRNGCCLWCGNCTHQLVRHRIGSYSQQSQRYVRLDQFEYIIPPAIEEIPRAKQLFIDAMEYDQEIYDKLTTLLIASELVKNKKYKKQVKDVMADLVKFDIKLVDEDGRLTDNLVNINVFVNRFFTKYPKDYLKVEKKAIEDARYVFPNACETKIILTMNVRSLYNFFEHRCCERSQWEIRELATEMLKQVKEVAPLLFKNCGPVCVRGKCQEGNMSCGLSLEKRKLFLSE